MQKYSEENGNLSSDYYGSDGIHLKYEGFHVWRKFSKKKFNKLIKN